MNKTKIVAKVGKNNNTSETLKELISNSNNKVEHQNIRESLNILDTRKRKIFSRISKFFLKLYSFIRKNMV